MPRALAITAAVIGAAAACNTSDATSKRAVPAAIAAPAAPIDGRPAAISRDEFAQLLRARITAAGIDVDYDRDAFALVARTDAGPGGTLQLGNVYEEYLDAPVAARPGRLDELADMMIHPMTAPKSLTMARARLRPIVRSTAYFDFMHDAATKRSKPGDTPATHPLDDVASIGLAIDSDTTFEVVNVRTLDEWHVSWDDAMAIALDNLRADGGPGFTSPSPGVWVSAWHDTYDTSRMLLPELVAGLHVRGRPVALVPARETLIIVGDRDAKALLAAADLAQAAFDSPRRIDLDARCWDRAWTPCLPDVTPAVAQRYQALRDLARDGLYAEQKPRLEQDATARGDDVFVASFIRRSDAHGVDHSYAVLTRGVATLLPRTEQLVFFDPDRPKGQEAVGIVRFDDALALLGARWTALPTSPARWRVEANGFPTAAELARLPQVPH